MEDPRFALRRQGYICLAEIFTNEVKDSIVTELEWLVEDRLRRSGQEAESPHGEAAEDLVHNLRRLSIFQPHAEEWIAETSSRLPCVQRAVSDPRILTIVESIFGSHVAVEPWIDWQLAASNTRGDALAWHQEALEHGAHLTAFFVLQSGCKEGDRVHLVPGSHHDGELKHGRSSSGPYLERVSDLDWESRTHLTLHAGDLLLLDRYLPHAFEPGPEKETPLLMKIAYTDLTDVDTTALPASRSEASEAGRTP